MFPFAAIKCFLQNFKKKKKKGLDARKDELFNFFLKLPYSEFQGKLFQFYKQTVSNSKKYCLGH